MVRFSFIIYFQYHVILNHVSVGSLTLEDDLRIHEEAARRPKTSRAETFDDLLDLMTRTEDDVDPLAEMEDLESQASEAILNGSISMPADTNVAGTGPVETTEVIQTASDGSVASNCSTGSCECTDGFIDNGNGCEPMTVEQVAEQEAAAAGYSVNIEINNGAKRCFIGSASNGNGNLEIKNGVVGSWFKTGVWDECKGDNDVCEIKVVRRNDVIQQIVSRCANQQSCSDNMRRNFSPATGPGNSFIYSSWIHQACRPRWSTTNRAGSRQRKQASICYFCVEPCRMSAVWDGTSDVVDADVMRAAECVGRAGDIGATPGTDSNGDNIEVWNAAPIPNSNIKLFDDCNDLSQATSALKNDAFRSCDRTIVSDIGEDLWDETAPQNGGQGPDMMTLNFYSVIDNALLQSTHVNSNNPWSKTEDISQIQYAQINARS